jgi:glycosyltransferase involved in cell wall biosynthesis
VISCLRRAGVEVDERHEPVWEGRADAWRAGVTSAARLSAAHARLLRRRPRRYDAVLVGYPGHFDLATARWNARGAPIVFNPLVSLYDTFVDDRARFAPRSVAGRALRAADRLAFRAADVVVADTAANASFFASLGARRVETCFVGAEERVFTPGPAAREPTHVLFVGKLIPLHGLETILAAAERASEVPFRVVGSGQLEPLLRRRPANVEWVQWVAYEDLPRELHAAGVALGVFGTSAKATRVIPNKVFQALATRTPVVTADTPAARELLDDDSALLVPPGDPDALAAAIRSLVGDAQLRTAFAEAGYAAYRARASEDVLGRRWRELLERAVADAG